MHLIESSSSGDLDISIVADVAVWRKIVRRMSRQCI